MKQRGNAKAHVSELSEANMTDTIGLDELHAECKQSIDHLVQVFSTQMALRTNVAAFDNLPVTTPNGRVLLSSLASITQKSPQLIIVDMSLKPDLTGAVRAAIVQSGMNVNPQQDAACIFVPIPKVTKEHRESMAKSAKAQADKAKERLRSIQSKALKAFKKNGASRGEDFVKSGEDTVSLSSFLKQVINFEN